MTEKQIEEDEWKTIFVGPKDTRLSTMYLNLSDDMIKELWETELDVKPEFELHGKICHMRRNIGFFSDQSKGYSYTNQIAKSRPLTPIMNELLEIVNRLTGQKFNGLLFNLYQNGNDYIGAHRDAEKNLTKSGVVALSLGVSRKFRIRDYNTKKILADVSTNNKELMWMQGEQFHKVLTHEVPIEKKIKDARLSITFRQHE